VDGDMIVAPALIFRSPTAMSLLTLAGDDGDDGAQAQQDGLASSRSTTGTTSPNGIARIRTTAASP
jgi:hypothetical protein